MELALKFLRAQQLLAIATADSNGSWIASVYFVSDERGCLYFVSPESARHSQLILKDSKIAFLTSWFDPNDHANRKSIQGTGLCHVVSDKDEIRKAVHLHNAVFEEFADRITPDWIETNEFGSKVWKIAPEYLKFWDDELFGDDEFTEIIVSRETMGN